MRPPPQSVSIVHACSIRSFSLGCVTLYHDDAERLAAVPHLDAVWQLPAVNRAVVAEIPLARVVLLRNGHFAAEQLSVCGGEKPFADDRRVLRVQNVGIHTQVAKVFRHAAIGPRRVERLAAAVLEPGLKTLRAVSQEPLVLV